ncbi:MAG: hypothetical protein KC561_19435 [Myxococcales bacterium]|nr:hypothetical protein [Myxococcales bacterium]
MAEDLVEKRKREGTLQRTLVLVLSVLFYAALVPLAVTLSGPLYSALQCASGECEQDGLTALFVLSSRGPLQTGSDVRLSNGDLLGEVSAFHATYDEQYSLATVRLYDNQHVRALLDGELRCEVNANFNIQMDADLVLSACPGQTLSSADIAVQRPNGYEDAPVFVCGSVDHFQRMGQELRTFVLENVRPGDYPNQARLNGPCGADNLASTDRLRQYLAAPSDP